MGKLKTLHVQVAGLCMIAQKDDKLFVLMPKVKHSGHTHCPYIHVPDPFVSGGAMVEISKQVLRLHDDWNTNKGSIFSLGNLVLEASWLTNNSPVKGRHISNAPDDDDLAARVELPLAAEPFAPLGEQASLNVVLPSGKWTKASSYGRIGITIDVTDKNQDDFFIRALNLRLTPQDESVEFTLLNIRPKDWQKDAERLKPAGAQDPGEHLVHLDSYFKLVSHTGVAPSVHGPKEGKNGANKRPEPETCRPLPYAYFPRWSGRSARSTDFEAKNIEPYSCTVGGGCPNGQC